MSIFYVALSAFGGGIVAGLLGWLESGENFIARKFGSTVLRALLAGGGFAISYVVLTATINAADIVIAFLAGAGVDVLGKRLAGSLKV